MYSEKEIAKLKRKHEAIGTERALLLAIIVMAEDYQLTDVQIGESAERIARASRFIVEKRAKLQDVANSIERRCGMRFDHFLGK